MFALGGAAFAIQKRFDIFGVLFLAFVVAPAGGITRDLLIGAVPPASIANRHTFAIAIGGGLLTFLQLPGHRIAQSPRVAVRRHGLGVFAVTGAEKALSYGINPLMAAALGMLSGIGGGMARDVLAGNVPFVLKADLYAALEREVTRWRVPRSRPTMQHPPPPCYKKCYKDARHKRPISLKSRPNPASERNPLRDASRKKAAGKVAEARRVHRQNDDHQY